MTVQETLTFYATLQLPDSNSRAQRQERIAEVLAAMGLSHTVDTLVSCAVLSVCLCVCVCVWGGMGGVVETGEVGCG